MTLWKNQPLISVSLPASPHLTSHSCPQLSVRRKAGSQLSVGMQGCRGRHDQIDQERLCGSASFPGHAFCLRPRGLLVGGPVVPWVEAGYHHHHLHAVESSGGNMLVGCQVGGGRCFPQRILALSNCTINTVHHQICWPRTAEIWSLREYFPCNVMTVYVCVSVKPHRC